nr:hypothetical protein [Tanacetum cinerariifolium]
MAIPNEHPLKRSGRNAATKKSQRNLLKQQYENFIASSSKMLDQTINRLQKLVSQLELLEEKLLQEYVNQKLLRSLSPEWNTHVVVWRNKDDLDTLRIDDLYNNLKVYEPEVKDEFVNKPVVENCKAKSSEEEPKVVRKNDYAPIIEEWVVDNEKEDMS